MVELAELDVEVRHNLEQLVQSGVRAIRAAVAQAGQEMRSTHVPAEAPVGETGTLSDPASWVVTEHDPLTHVVTPDLEAFYAHIVARGRGPVRPSDRRALTIGDQFRMLAGPASADPFDERAVAAAEGRTDELIAAALSAEGI